MDNPAPATALDAAALAEIRARRDVAERSRWSTPGSVAIEFKNCEDKAAAIELIRADIPALLAEVERLARRVEELELAARREEWRPWSELPEEWKDGRRFLAWFPTFNEWSILCYRTEGFPKDQAALDAAVTIEAMHALEYEDRTYLDYAGDAIGPPTESLITHFRAMPAPPQEKADE